jgi:hypothetical protein
MAAAVGWTPQQLIGNGNALGRRVRFTQPEDGDPGEIEPARWFEIVGVVADLQTNAIDPTMAQPVLYHPLASAPGGPVTLMVRLRGVSATGFVARLRELTTAIDPSMRLIALPMVDMYRQQNLAFRLVAIAVSLVVISVLLLSAAGIYALMSFTVAARRKEIGIRAALGADAGGLLRSIFSRAAAQLAAGVATGAIAVLAIDGISGGEALGKQGTILVPIMAVLMVSAGLIAAAGPARRGLRIQPTAARELNDERRTTNGERRA